MQALVTGGAGFIGSHLVERLLKEGHKVIVIDNLSTGRAENLNAQKQNHNLSIIEADVSDFDNISMHFKNVDVVFHLAALADIVPSIENPRRYYQSNVSGTVSVAEASRLTGVKKIIYAASSSCYGLPESFPTKETARVSPQYPYALTKYLAEEILFHWARTYGLSTVCLRLFNVYGPRARSSGRYGAVFGVFLAQKLNKRPFTVVGDGEQTRDFIYISDVVAAFLAAAQFDCKYELFNVGSGNTYSINRLIELLGGEAVHIPKRPGEPDCTQADISKIKRLLGWQPRVSFEQGVNKLFDQIDYWKDAPVWTPESISKATQAWFEHLS